MKEISNMKKWLLCYALFAGSGLASCVSPVIQTLAAHYPDVPMATIRSIITIPSLIAFLFSAVASLFLGKKLPYKPTVIAGALLYMIGGVMPCFINASFSQIIFSRVVTGLGMGVFAMRNAIITNEFRYLGVKDTGKWIGYGAFIVNIVAVVVQILGGRLGDIDWRYAFAIHFVIVTWLMILIPWFKEPKFDQAVEAKSDAVTVNESKEDRRIVNPKVFIFFAITLVAALSIYPYLLSVSTFVVERGMGTATQAGWASSAYTVGGCIAGVIFGKFMEKFNRWSTTLSAVIVIAGYLLCLLSQSSLGILLLGGVLCGGGWTLTLLTGTQRARELASDYNLPFSMTLISCAVSSGSYVSTYFMAFANKIGSKIPLFSTEIEKTFLVGMLVYAIIAIIGVVKDFRPETA